MAVASEPLAVIVDFQAERILVLGLAFRAAHARLRTGVHPLWPQIMLQEQAAQVAHRLQLLSTGFGATWISAFQFFSSSHRLASMTYFGSEMALYRITAFIKASIPISFL